MAISANRKYIFYLLSALLVVLILLGGKYAIHNYLDKSSPLEALSYAEDCKYSYYDNVSRIFLGWSDDYNCYIMNDKQKNTEYRVVFRRGLGKYSFATFSSIDSDYEFSGSATISKDALCINIECDSKEYGKLYFIKV